MKSAQLLLIPLLAIVCQRPVATLSSPSKTSTLQVQQQQQPQVEFRYGAIVDCGSSGTRAHIFRWPADSSASIEQLKDPTSGKAVIKRLQPGLATLSEQPELASDYMHPVMDFLGDNIPVGAQKSTQIYFLGTAGLRLLQPEAQQQILDDISRDLPRDYPNFGNSSNLFTRVISGQEEGSYQWLSVNSHAKRLGEHYDLPPTTSDFHCQAPRARRFGLLEMGGASVQVSFELGDQVDYQIRRALRGNAEALRAYLGSQVDVPVEVAAAQAKKKRIFSATFLGFGSNNARNLAVSLLVRESGSQITANRSPTIFYGSNSSNNNNTSATLLVEDPCLPVGAHELHQRPLMALLDQTRPIAYDDAAHDEQPSLGVRLYGGGNFARCQRLLARVLVAFKRELINCRSMTTGVEPCTTHLLGTGFVPFQVFQFLGLGDFYHTTHLMLEQSGQFRLAPVLRRLMSICSLPYHVLLGLYPDANRVDGARVRQECFKATWLLALLQVGFRMPFGSNDFQTVAEINGQELDWTTGAMLVQLFDWS